MEEWKVQPRRRGLEWIPGAAEGHGHGVSRRSRWPRTLLGAFGRRPSRQRIWFTPGLLSSIARAPGIPVPGTTAPQAQLQGAGAGRHRRHPVHVHRRRWGRMGIFALGIMPYQRLGSSCSLWRRWCRRWSS